MNLDKSWHAISMKWLVIYVVMNSVWIIMLPWWHGIGMGEVLYPRIGKNGMVWNQHGIWMRMGYKGWR